MSKQPKDLEDLPQGRLRVSRDSAKWRDKWRAYTVLIDGNAVGKVKRGASVSMPLAPGPHVALLRINWCSSPELPIEIPNGAELHLECGPARSELGNARQMTEAPHTYLWLRVAEPSA